MPSSRGRFSHQFEKVIHSECAKGTLTHKTFLTEEALCEEPCSSQLGNSSMFVLTRGVQPAKCDLVFVALQSCFKIAKVN